jgi:hypothetical protein
MDKMILAVREVNITANHECRLLSIQRSAEPTYKKVLSKSGSLIRQRARKQSEADLNVLYLHMEILVDQLKWLSDIDILHCDVSHFSASLHIHP